MNEEEIFLHRLTNPLSFDKLAFLLRNVVWESESFWGMLNSCNSSIWPLICTYSAKILTGWHNLVLNVAWCFQLMMYLLRKSWTSVSELGWQQFKFDLLQIFSWNLKIKKANLSPLLAKPGAGWRVTAGSQNQIIIIMTIIIVIAIIIVINIIVVIIAIFVVIIIIIIAIIVAIFFVIIIIAIIITTISWAWCW